MSTKFTCLKKTKVEISFEFTTSVKTSIFKGFLKTDVLLGMSPTVSFIVGMHSQGKNVKFSFWLIKVHLKISNTCSKYSHYKETCCCCFHFLSDQPEPDSVVLVATKAVKIMWCGRQRPPCQLNLNPQTSMSSAVSGHNKCLE